MKNQEPNIDEYWSLESIDIDISKEEANKLFGEELIVYKNNIYIPKNICRRKLLKLHQEHGAGHWITPPTRRGER